MDNNTPEFDLVSQDFEYSGYQFKISPLQEIEVNLIKRAKFHPINIRQVFDLHTKVLINDSWIIPTTEMFFSQPAIVKGVVKEIYNITPEILYEESDSFNELIAQSKNHFLTLDGAYDLFIIRHGGGIDKLIETLSMSSQIKAMYIAALELQTHISVKERFRECMASKDKVLDLEPPNQDKQNAKQHHLNKIVEDANRRGINPDDVIRANETLLEQMQKEKTNSSNTFNWQHDHGPIPNR